MMDFLAEWERERLLERFSSDCLWRGEARSKRGKSIVYLPDL
jgi:hypothetical protein